MNKKEIIDFANCSLGKRYSKEHFELKKFGRGFNVLNPIWWSKAVSDFFKVLVICGIIFGLIFGWGYWKGIGNKPLLLGYKDFVAYATRNGVEHKVEVKSSRLYLDDKLMTVSNIPQLKPFGIRIRPKLFAGIGASGGEVGLGAELAHYFRFNFDVFGTQKAFYAGISYDIEWAEWIRNSSTGIAIGKAWQNPEDTRILWYWSIKF